MKTKSFDLATSSTKLSELDKESLEMAKIGIWRKTIIDKAKKTK